MFLCCRASLVCLSVVALAATLSAQPAPGFLPSQSIYQIFTDRFFDGDPSNNNASGSFNASHATRVHGGDFRGVEQKLDYIKALGATAIWLSPIVLNGNGEYHGYAGRNFFAVDPHWGTLADLQSLVNAAHAKGLLVIQDVVVNHGGTLITSSSPGFPTFNYPAGYVLRYANAGRQYAAPFNTNATFPNLTNLFHNYGEIQDYGSPLQTERGELSGLDDFRTELAYIRTNMAAVYQHWIQAVGFDGFRVDTVKHTEMGFWQDWCPAIRTFANALGKTNFFMFGEVYDGNDAKCGSYTGTQGGGTYKHDSVLDFPLYFRASDVFARATAPTKSIEDRYAALGNYHPDARNQLVTFLDNHDLPRFLHSSNADGNTNRLAVALTFLHTGRGVPCLYQGTEQAFNGGHDPANREDMFAGSYEQGPSLGDNFNMTHPLFQLVAKLNNFRRLYPALRTGDHVNSFSNAGGPGLLAYARRLGPQEVFVVLNTAASTQSLPARPTIHPVGTTLVNLLDPAETITVTTGPTIPAMNVSGNVAKLFIAQSQQLALDPVVSGISPAHDVMNVSPLAPLVLEFSQPMDTNSVQAAFSTTPAVSGSFAWSPARDTLTFTPTVSWPGLTMMLVRLADTAQAANTTNRFHAAFESRFRTAAVTDLVPPSVEILSPTNGAMVGGVLMMAGTAADNIGVTSVEVRLDNGAWLNAIGATHWNYSLNTFNLLNGTHTLAARARDAAGNISPTKTVTVRFLNVPGDYFARLSAGNPVSVTNCDSAVWLADQAYTGGSFGYVGGAAGVVINVVTGMCAAAQSLYQRERYSTSAGGFRYLFDCPIGVYETILLEAETWWNAPGQRLFHLFIEGTQVLTNFDILASAGGRNLPLTLTFTNDVADGQLELLFTPVVDNARVSGVQARKIADLYSDTDGIPDWWRLAYFDRATGDAVDLSCGEDDADGDGASNKDEFLAGTNPLDPDSIFRITAFHVLAGSNAVVWPTVLGKTYALQQSAAPAPAFAWTNTGAAFPGTGGWVTQYVSAPGAFTEFYRVVAE